MASVEPRAEMYHKLSVNPSSDHMESADKPNPNINVPTLPECEDSAEKS